MLCSCLPPQEQLALNEANEVASVLEGVVVKRYHGTVKEELECVDVAVGEAEDTQIEGEQEASCGNDVCEVLS